MVTENLQAAVFVQVVQCDLVFRAQEGRKGGRNADLVTVVRDKHLFSDMPGTPAGLAVDRCWHEREWNQETFSRNQDSGKAVLGAEAKRVLMNARF